METPKSGYCATQWSTAVELGARGYVCAGEALLEGIGAVASRRDPALASLCASTRASWIRQVGRHGDAALIDGVAATIAFDAVDADPTPLAIAALADALTGLAADNLGIGRFAVTARLLDRVEHEVLPRVDVEADFVVGARLRLRWRWVSTELALYSGQPELAAQRSAAGVDAARSVPSVRHRAKTDLIAAAAAAVNGDVSTARELAAASEELFAAEGLVPLQWAALTMLSGLAGAGVGADGVDGGTSDGDLAQRRRVDSALTAAVATLRHRGMTV